MSTNPFYSVGSRLIDNSGQASVRTIQFVDDTIVVGPVIDCLSTVTCPAQVTIDDTLSTRALSITNGHKLNLKDAKVTFANTASPTDIYLDRLSIFDRQGFYLDVSAEATVIGSAAESTVYIGTSRPQINADTLNFVNGDNSVKIMGNLLPEFLSNHDSLGSLWLLYGYAKYTNTDQWTFDSGVTIHHDTSQWIIYAKDTEGETRNYSVYLYEGGIRITTQSSYVTVQPKSTEISSRSYQFITLTPIRVEGARSWMALAMRIA